MTFKRFIGYHSRALPGNMNVGQIVRRHKPSTAHYYRLLTHMRTAMKAGMEFSVETTSAGVFAIRRDK